MIQVAIIMPQVCALMPRSSVPSAIDIPAQLIVVMRNARIIVANVSPVSPRIVGEHRSRAHSQHQQHSSNLAFHILSSSAPCGFY
jgi:hypothetical protein